MSELVKIVKADKKQLQHYGEVISEAFLNEPGSYPGPFSKRDLREYFALIAELGVKGKGFYVLQEDGQDAGYLIAWKKSRSPEFMKFWISLKMMFVLDANKVNRFMAPMQNWKDYEEWFRKEKDYLDVFLVCVPIPMQHRHHFRKLMSYPKNWAEEAGIKCILETDATVKMEKYRSAGFRVVTSATLSNGVNKYIMEYDSSAGCTGMQE